MEMATVTDFADYQEGCINREYDTKRKVWYCSIDGENCPDVGCFDAFVSPKCVRR